MYLQLENQNESKYSFIVSLHLECDYGACYFTLIFSVFVEIYLMLMLYIILQSLHNIEIIWKFYFTILIPEHDKLFCTKAF